VIAPYFARGEATAVQVAESEMHETGCMSVGAVAWRPGQWQPGPDDEPSSEADMVEVQWRPAGGPVMILMLGQEQAERVARLMINLSKVGQR
jgi:hypothetical protein